MFYFLLKQLRQLCTTAPLPIRAWVLWCPFMPGKSQWLAFAIAACATVVYLAVGQQELRSIEYRVEQKQQRAAEAFNVASLKTNYDAHRALALLTGCLIEYRAAHPNAGFPATLSALPHDLQLPDGAACASPLANPRGSSEHTVTC